MDLLQYKKNRCAHHPSSIKSNNMTHSTHTFFSVQRWVILLLLIGCVVGLNACISYQRVPLSYLGVLNADKTKAHLYLIDNQHVTTNIWSVQEYHFEDQKISFMIKKIPQSQRDGVVQITSQEGAKRSMNNLLFFAKPALIDQIQNSDSITFDFHQLERIETTEIDYKTTIKKSNPIIPGTILALLAIFAFIDFNN
jgi:hypothetical protein